MIYLGLTSNTTMRSLNSMLCRFYGLPGAHRGTADVLAQRATGAVAASKTRLIIVDDVHFLDVTRRDGREVANHFKWLANTFPVTFLFVGVGLRARGLLDEGLCGADAAFSQTARRWNVLTLEAFEIATAAGRGIWRNLLLGIERDLVLANTSRGMVADQLSDYLFARSSGHFASLMSLIARGCYRAVATGSEALSVDLLDGIRIDQAAETARTRAARRVQRRAGHHRDQHAAQAAAAGNVRGPDRWPGTGRAGGGGMTPRLPFTLTPLPGEPFGLWWHTYACALGVTRADLAETVGIPTDQAPNPAHAPAIAAAAGLPPAEVAALFTSTRPDPADHILRAWTPGPTSWWCPDCLAAEAAWHPAWRLPVTFYCLTHDRPLDRGLPRLRRTRLLADGY